MADECGFNRTMFLPRINAAAQRIRHELPAAVDAVRAMPGGDHPLLGAFAAAIEARCRVVALNLTLVEGDAEDEDLDEIQEFESSRKRHLGAVLDRWGPLDESEDGVPPDPPPLSEDPFG